MCFFEEGKPCAILAALSRAPQTKASRPGQAGLSQPRCFNSSMDLWAVSVNCMFMYSSFSLQPRKSLLTQLRDVDIVMTPCMKPN